MTGRISRATMFMMMAKAVAMRSTCCRLNVGAVIVHENSIVSIGYNGAPAGAPHCAGDACPGRLECRETIHAELNAIRRVPIELQSKSLDIYVTHSPCRGCFDLIYNGGFHRLFFEVPYRQIDHLKSGDGLNIYQVMPAGYIINWDTSHVEEIV